MSEKIDRIKELFLFDIIIATAKIREIAKDFDNGEALKYSWQQWDSIIREFEIVGEAMRYCLRFELFEESRDKRKVIDFRNIIAHKYFGIDSDAVLDIAQNNLDWLDEIIINRINEIEPNYKKELIYYMIDENRYLDFVVKKLNSL